MLLNLSQSCHRSPSLQIFPSGASALSTSFSSMRSVRLRKWLSCSLLQSLTCFQRLGDVNTWKFQGMAVFWPPGLAQPEVTQPDAPAASKIIASWAVIRANTFVAAFPYTVVIFSRLFFLHCFPFSVFITVKFLYFGPKCDCQMILIKIQFFFYYYFFFW